LALAALPLRKKYKPGISLSDRTVKNYHQQDKELPWKELRFIMTRAPSVTVKKKLMDRKIFWLAAKVR
jgi:hypothetical protein